MSILLIGGSGTLGNALVERLLKDGKHKRIAIFSRDEFKQFNMRQKFNDDPRLRFLIGDCRNKERLQTAMEGVKEVVLCAAMKQVSTCEYSPLEVKLTNIDGAANTIECAHNAKVKKCLYISSDKAAAPRNLYGVSKLFAEKLFLAANNMYGKESTRYSICRYGNVFRSRGSLVPKWEEILKTSDTVPVTDPDATRYFMRASEAVDLVLNTLKTMKGGEIAVPDLPAFRIEDLVDALGANMKIIGMDLSVEKIHETMDEITDSSQARRMSVNELKKVLEGV